ncbi:MmcQ/YjbR family DNA-binding protein [Sphingobacterium phlebotomi]|uniref:MmcQ/YjbR family DNA-binding protein n=1 Tax=Sphingobacterium phlebotomi TaxID=2605433 RepID=A0A5D4H3D0_9SPHI|nr:MmcQ/YjbR family DNA-binding protein [Sphingobacterium phlebotomi]TYR35024.1 MmcQ/YjbR family DNA-binding protein [Sphingobacterium phlebotomi]
MNIEDIREYCIAKPAVTEELPFGPDTLVFKVGGKVFLLVGLDQVESLSFNVKCDPDIAVELRLNYPETVIPGYHMNKKHWNTVYCNRQLPDERLRMFIDDSYALVYNSLSKAVRESIAYY